MTRAFFEAFAALTWAGLMASTSHAQRPDCATALARAEAISPAAHADSIARVAYGLDRCDSELGRGLGALMRRLKARTDTAALAPVHGLAMFYHDTAVYAGAMSVANDATASTLARVLAIATLIEYELPGGAAAGQLNALVSVPQGGVCEALGRSSPGEVAVRSEVPFSRTPSRDLARRLEPTTGAVGSAAHCLLAAWRFAHDVPGFQRETVQLSLNGFGLAYVCGNRFRVSNRHAFVVPVRIGVEGERQVTAYLPPRQANGTPSETLVDLGIIGTARLTFDGILVMTRANGGTMCR